MENFVRFLITPLLTKPEELSLEISGGLTFVSVSTEDAGRVIGKKGNIITAIRTLLKSYCVNHRLAPTGITIRSLAGIKTD